MKHGSSFDRSRIEAEQREQLLQQEHVHRIAKRRRSDLQQLATMLSYQVTGATREQMVEALSAPSGVRLAIIATAPEKSTCSFERTYNSAGRYVLLAPGEEASDFAGETIELTRVLSDFLDQRNRARRNSGQVELPGASLAVIEREKERLRAELAERIATVEDGIVDITMNEISHFALTSEERDLIESTLREGSERNQQELILIRRAVAGPTGEIEPAVTLHKWTPEAERPESRSLGAGAKVLNLAELREAARERAIARERFGADALQEFPGYREPVI